MKVLQDGEVLSGECRQHFSLSSESCSHKLLLEGNISVLGGKLGFLVILWFVCLLPSALASFPKVSREISTSYFPLRAAALAALELSSPQGHSRPVWGPRDTCPAPEEVCEHLQHLLTLSLPPHLIPPSSLQRLFKR